MEKTSSPNSRFTVCRPFRQRCSAAQRVSVNVFFCCCLPMAWSRMSFYDRCLRLSPDVSGLLRTRSHEHIYCYLFCKIQVQSVPSETRKPHELLSHVMIPELRGLKLGCNMLQPSTQRENIAASTDDPQEGQLRELLEKDKSLGYFQLVWYYFFGGKSTKSWYEGFLKWGYPKIIPNWTILVLKPMVLGIPPFKKPHHIASYSIISRQTSSASWRFRILWGNVSPGLLNPDN